MPRIKFYFILPVLFLLFSVSCQKGIQAPATNQAYDIIMLMGQSNTLGGTGLNQTIDDDVQPDINQLGRFGAANYTVIPAAEPLQNNTPESGSIGFATTFAKLYAAQKLQNGRQILIIPCGASGTGFGNTHWNRGNDLYIDAVNRANFVLQSFRGSKIVCFLWHQGEADWEFGGAYYQILLENMIKGLCTDIKQKNIINVPFIMGGLVPYWVRTNHQYVAIDSTLRNEPSRLPVAGFADPLIPFIIKKPVDTVNAIHFNADGQREMGKRYFSEYTRLAK